MAVRSAYLRHTLQLCDELALACGMRESLEVDPADPPRQLQRRLRRAIRECCESIRENRTMAEAKSRRLSRADVLEIEKLLERGVSVRKITITLGRHCSTVRAIRDGKHRIRPNETTGELMRCPDCGGLVTHPDEPCRLCECRRATCCG